MKFKSIEKNSMKFPQESFSEKHEDGLFRPNKSQNDFLRLSFSELVQRAKIIIGG
jgi:hypothetical protein